MKRAVLETIRRYDMLQKGDRLLLAVSGGPDSVALAHLLSDFRSSMDLELMMAHVNYGLRGKESEDDEAFVGNLAKSLKIPLQVERIDLPGIKSRNRGSLEEKAREARYAFFNEMSEQRELDKIATGHNKNDQAETFLERLMRGSGPVGLASIRPVLANKIIRPLIEQPEEKILQFLEEHRYPFRTDSSNTDVSLLRNRIRHRLIPCLEKEFNRNIVDVLARTACIFREEAEWMAGETEKDLGKVLFYEKGRYFLDQDKLLTYPPPRIRRILRESFRKVKGDVRSISFYHIESILHLIKKKGGKKMISLPDLWDVIREHDRIYIEPHQERENVQYSYSMEAPGVLDVPEAGKKFRFRFLTAFNYNNHIAKIKKTSYNRVYLDADKTGQVFTIRNRRKGDRFFPLGACGERKLKEFFIDKKVEVGIRDILPLIVGKEDILWVPGYAVNERYKVTENTETALIIERIK